MVRKQLLQKLLLEPFVVAGKTDQRLSGRVGGGQEYGMYDLLSHTRLLSRDMGLIAFYFSIVRQARPDWQIMENLAMAQRLPV